VREGEPSPRAAEAGDDLVGDEENVVAIADLTHEGKVVVGRVEHAATPVYRLGDEGGDGVRAFADNGSSRSRAAV
jgi:hypothetical protein